MDEMIQSVSRFIENNCHLRSVPNWSTVEGLNTIVDLLRPNSHEADYINIPDEFLSDWSDTLPFCYKRGFFERFKHHIGPSDANQFMVFKLTGSVAEMYIEPAVPCCNDVDLMFTYNHCICIPDSQVAADSINRNHMDVVPAYIVCYSIVPDVDYPGFVYMKQREILQYCWETEQYLSYLKCGDVLQSTFSIQIRPFLRDYNERSLLKRSGTANNEAQGIPNGLFELHGPAATGEVKRQVKLYSNEVLMSDNDTLQIDKVLCRNCTGWPIEASAWITRRRPSGWPCTELMNRVINGGYHVVSSVSPRLPGEHLPMETILFERRDYSPE